MTGSIAAVSVGIVKGEAVIDLDYPEDSTAETDMNVVMTGDGRFIEVQGTAEGAPFDRAALDGLLDLAVAGIPSGGRAVAPIGNTGAVTTDGAGSTLAVSQLQIGFTGTRGAATEPVRPLRSGEPFRPPGATNR